MSSSASKISPELADRVRHGKIEVSKFEKYQRMVKRIETELMPHPIVRRNEFTAWFKKGEFDRADVKHFLVQFSVFSNLFLEAQLRKVINSPNMEAMHTSKEILLNELGVVFKGKSKAPVGKVEDMDHNLVGTEGTVEGGTFRFAAAHFEWMLRMTSHLDLTFNDIGKRRHGTKSTLFFCDELARLYGSEDNAVGLGASFAVENWAAAGFWKELIAGLEAFKKRECPTLPLAYFLWHDRVEDQHAAHTWHELEEDFFESPIDIDENKFFAGAAEMLAGVQAFWEGLNQDRLKKP
jgi:hypothetical protein